MNYTKIIDFYRLIRWIGIFGCLFLFTGTAQSAYVNWYKIEVIVFGQQSPNTEKFGPTGASIDWPEDLVELFPQNVRLESLPSEPTPYSTVAAADSKLAYLYQKLGQSPDYSPLLRVAWIQPVTKNQSGEAVHLAGNNVAGYVRLQRGSYLHLVVDLTYAESFGANAIPSYENGSDESSDKASETIYQIKERRRILLKETHYFDHPRLGVIIKVTPLSINRSDS